MKNKDASPADTDVKSVTMTNGFELQVPAAFFNSQGPHEGPGPALSKLIQIKPLAVIQGRRKSTLLISLRYTSLKRSNFFREQNDILLHILCTS